MAPLDAKDTILEALAMGADEAYLLSDRKFGGADTWATSYVLAEGIKIGGADLVFTATESGDGATASLIPIRRVVRYPHLWGVIECDIKDKEDVYLKTKIENGYMEWNGQLPMVLAVAEN